ncbi:MAG TPA: hypothetical protein DEA90_10480, partial [Opitutae bacterium]|nr:hypothetical protein [Opitutae bacterium]
MRFLKIPLLFCLATLVSLQAFAQKTHQLPAGIEPVQTLDGIEEYRLKSNGLSILLMPNEGLPVATVMVTYKVG